MSVAGTPADCVRLGAPSPGSAAELGPVRDQRRRQPGHGHSSFGDRRGRSRSGHPRCSRNRLVALYREGPGRRLGPGRTVGGGDPAQPDGTTMGSRAHSGTSISPTSRPSSPNPRSFSARSTLLPCPFATASTEDQAVYAGDYQSRCTPAGVRRRCLFRRQDRRDLDPGCRRRSRPTGPFRRARPRRSLIVMRRDGFPFGGEMNRPREKVWPTGGRACHNVDRSGPGGANRSHLPV